MFAQLTLLVPVLTFITTGALVLALRPAPNQGLRRRLAPYGRRPVSARERVLAASASQRLVQPTAQAAINLLAAITPARIRERSALELARAGFPLDVNTYLALRSLGMIGLPLAYVGFLALSRQPVEPIALLLVALLFLLGGRLGGWWIRSQTKKRENLIERALPGALDLLTVCLEAGLSFDSGLAKVVEKTSGPLADEFGRVLQEMHLAKPRREALRDLVRRVSVRDLSSFVAAILQADQMGMSLTPVMRLLADEVRTQRRQRAEERAQQAAVKMLFPLIFCILPAMMLVVLGPTFVMLYTEILAQMAAGF